jgi:glycosyltransferase involved in cell wall biosynthesis
MRIGYAPYSRELTQPADRRRFPYYAEKRGLDFELADPGGDYDVVVVTPRANLAQWAGYRPGRARIIFDIVDSYLDVPRTDPKALLRGPAKFAAGESRTPFFSWRRSVERILERAAAATCATPEQAAQIRRFCPNVHPILDFQTRMISVVKQDYEARAPFKLVWEGLGENVRWFSEIREPLAEVAGRHPLELHLVTAVRFKQISQRFWERDTAAIAKRFYDNVHIHQWTEDSVAQIATRCDLAVIPLPRDRPLEHGKPESKLVSFWRMGLPTVTSATPAYTRVMQAAGQHWQCASAADWVGALETLVEDREARERSGRGGHAFAEAEYSDERLLSAWDAVLASI